MRLYTGAAFIQLHSGPVGRFLQTDRQRKDRERERERERKIDRQMYPIHLKATLHGTERHQQLIVASSIQNISDKKNNIFTHLCPQCPLRKRLRAGWNKRWGRKENIHATLKEADVNNQENDQRNGGDRPHLAQCGQPIEMLGILCSGGMSVRIGDRIEGIKSRKKGGRENTGQCRVSIESIPKSTIIVI